MIQGRRYTGACGHVREFVVGGYAACVDMPECTGEAGGCAKCGSRDLYPFVSPYAPPDSVACKRCGAVRWNGV